MPATPLISAILTYDDGGGKREKTAARLLKDALELDAADFFRRIRLSDIVSVSAARYNITVILKDQTITLSMLGHLYEDFAKRFIRACNEVFFGESLMREKVHFEAQGQYVSPDGALSPAVLRICETALVVLPETHALVRVPFCMIASEKREPYRFTITDRLGRGHVLQKLGRDTDRFLREYDARTAGLIRQTTARLAEIAPVTDTLARLMPEGLVVPVDSIRAVSPEFADALDKSLAASQIAREYAHIKSVCDKLAVGIKRGLMGDLTGESLVLLGHVAGAGRVIMESLGAAAATYVFRMDTGWESFVPAFNESMLAVNFRREPIYLSDEALQTQAHTAYRYALTRCPALARLRSLFVGRAGHSGFDAWKRALDAYIDQRG